MVNGRPDNFFAVIHQHSGHIVSWADAVDRGNGQISVLYKIMCINAQYYYYLRF